MKKTEEKPTPKCPDKNVILYMSQKTNGYIEQLERNRGA